MSDRTADPIPHDCASCGKVTYTKVGREIEGKWYCYTCVTKGNIARTSNPKLLASHRREIEQSIQEALHPKGMQAGTPEVRLPIWIVQRMMAIIDALPADEAKGCTCDQTRNGDVDCPVHGQRADEKDGSQMPQLAIDAETLRLTIAMLERFRDGRIEASNSSHELLLGPKAQLIEEARLFSLAVEILQREQPYAATFTQEPALETGASRG